jgi:DNA-binding transcriptional LysR family regulator
VANELERVDLNLLLPLNALLIERNVTKAAERLQVGQPAMSTSLAKLRKIFDDPLLVRDGRGMALTPFAEALHPPLRAVLEAARAVLTSGTSFDPSSDHRTFTVVASDYCSAILLAPALRGLTTEAPGLRVRIEPLRDDFVERLRNRRCDLLIWPRELLVKELMTFPQDDLFTEEVVIAAAAGNTSLEEPLTAEGLKSSPRVEVAGVGESQAASEERMVQFMPERRTIATVDSFTLALSMVAETELITMTQRRLFDRLSPALKLREVETTASLPRLTEAMFWHPRSSGDPAHRWLRDRLKGAASALG